MRVDGWIAADKSEPLCGAAALIVPPSVGARYRRSRRDHSQFLASAAVPDLRGEFRLSLRQRAHHRSGQRC
jgi:hypothetical protein